MHDLIKFIYAVIVVMHVQSVSIIRLRDQAIIFVQRNALNSLLLNLQILKKYVNKKH